MTIKKLRKKFLSFLLAASLMAPLAACSDDGAKDEKLKYTGKINATISSDSKWVNSSIDGAIDEKLQTNLNDDFYSYVNKDWILKTKLGKDGEQKGFISENEDLVKERKISIVSGEKDPEVNEDITIDIAPEELEHDAQILKAFTDKAANWDERNQLGLQPLKPHIDKIQSISSLEEMTSYITDLEGANITGKSFVDVSLDSYGLLDTKKYQLQLKPISFYLLKSQISYKNILSMSEDSFDNLENVDKMEKAVLKEFGYSDEEVESMIKQAYDVECQLVDYMLDADVQESVNYYERLKENTYSLDELDELSGDYPLKQYLQAAGCGDKVKIHCCESSYLKGLGKIYKESNLEKMKSYYTIVSVLLTSDLLDRTSYDRLQKYLEREVAEQKDEGDGDQRETEVKDEWDLILKEYISAYMAGPLDTIYISRYCNARQKEQLTELVNHIVENYKTMIDQEDWLSKEAREKTKEKLNSIKINVLYPDSFDSYMGIQFTEDDSLLSMVQKIELDKKKKSLAIAGNPVDNTRWDLSSNPSTVVNAYYMPSHNSINILAGIIANGNVYNENMTEEEKLATIGTIVGHEISHAFDQTGSNYDKDGNHKTWWKANDVVAFQLRNTNLTSYYDTLQGYPDSGDLKGSLVAGEAVADMGGMKVCLGIAKSIDTFDYDKYFRCYAKLWRNRQSLGDAQARFEGDAHPLDFLRVNVTLMQFDEFVNTYDIKKGDGMYMAPKKRIAVW